MVAELAALIVLVVASGAELWHTRRLRRVAPLAFGPARRPRLWALMAPVLRVAAVTALAWGMTTLMLIPPKIHRADAVAEEDNKHVILVLDVSPSMRLQDAGPDGDRSRMERVSAVMESFFKRVAIQQYDISVVAFYNGAKPVVVDTNDVDVVRNILNDLPMHYAFQAGKTDIFAGLEAAAEIAKPWKPRSTTVILASDGDTVSATGMPKMPASVSDVLVIGVGDPISGRFIDGRQSRQDVSTLRQIAVRLRGTYHNGNEKHLSTATLRRITQTQSKSQFERLTRREFALLACAIGGIVFAGLPLMLHLFGTGWKPGTKPSRAPGERDGGKKVLTQSPAARYNSRTASHPTNLA